MTTIVPNHRTLSLQFPHQAYILLKRPTKNPEKKTRPGASPDGCYTGIRSVWQSRNDNWDDTWGTRLIAKRGTRRSWMDRMGYWTSWSSKRGLLCLLLRSTDSIAKGQPEEEPSKSFYYPLCRITLPVFRCSLCRFNYHTHSLWTEEQIRGCLWKVLQICKDGFTSPLLFYTYFFKSRLWIFMRGKLKYT